VNIETTEDLKEALEKIGYSNSAIAEILKWYNSEENSLAGKS